MNNLDIDYLTLVRDILLHGSKKNTRNGQAISLFGKQIKHKMSSGFPLLTTKKMYFKGIATELLWFLKGRTDLRYLLDNDCNIWVGDCYHTYLKQNNKDWLKHIKTEEGVSEMWVPLTEEEFVHKIKTDDHFNSLFGDLGKIYGFQWRKWNRGDGMFVDQISDLINQLKETPDSRRMVVNAWAVHDLQDMVIPPCHYGFQVYTRELSVQERIRLLVSLRNVHTALKESVAETDLVHSLCDQNNIPKRAISLMFNMRSIDVPLGLPFNIASYALLLEIIGRMVDMVPDELIANLGDCHIYLDQLEGIKKQLTREPMKLPKLLISDEVIFNGSIDDLLESCNKHSFKLDDYKSHSSIKIPLSN